MIVAVPLFVFCRLLIQAGYDVNIKDYDGWTPLHAAAHWGKEEACRILVENLCDMDVINKMVCVPGMQASKVWQLFRFVFVQVMIGLCIRARRLLTCRMKMFWDTWKSCKRNKIWSEFPPMPRIIDWMRSLIYSLHSS